MLDFDVGVLFDALDLTLRRRASPS